MVLVHEDSVVMLTSCITVSTRMLAMLANATVTSADVTALLAVLPQACVNTS